VSNACPIKESVASLLRMVCRVINPVPPVAGAEVSAAMRAGAPRPPFECCPHLNARLRPNPAGQGMVCVSSHTRPGKPGLHVDDVVTHINGLQLAGDGTVPVPFWCFPLHWKSLLNRCHEGGDIELTLQPNRRIRVPIDKSLDASRLWYPELDPIPFCTIGGLVVQPLSLNCLRLPSVLARYGGILSSPAAKVLGVLVVTHISPDSPFVDKQSDLVQVYDQITSIEVSGRGEVIRADLTSGSGLMQQYVDAMRRAAQGAAQGAAVTVELRMLDGRRVRVSVDAAADAWATAPGPAMALDLAPVPPRAPAADASGPTAAPEGNLWAPW